MYFCLTDSCVLQEAGKKYYKKNQPQIRNNKKTLTIITDNKTSLIEDHFSLFFFYLDFVSTIENARGKKIYIYIFCCGEQLPVLKTWMCYIKFYRSITAF